MATNPQSGMLSDWYSSYVNNPPKAEQATAAQAGTTTWTPGKDSTVQGQLTGILDAGGPLQDRAATRAAQQMNSRGLLNSSMAVTAGQSALYDAALPIAQQDAQTMGRAGEFNAGASNTAAIANANMATDVSRSNAQERNNMSGMLFQKAADFGLEDKRQTFQAGENVAQRAFQTGERVAQNQFQTGERVAQNDFGAAQALLDRDQQMRVQQLQESGTDRRQAEQIAAQERAQASTQVFETARQQVQNDFGLRMQQLQESGLDSRQATQIAAQEAIVKLGEAGVQNRFDAEQALRSSQFNAEQVAEDRRLAQQHANELERLGMSNKLALENVPAAMAAQTTTNTLNAVNAILADPNLTPEAKKGAIQNATDYANSQLAWLGTFYKTAFPPMSTPEAPTAAVPVVAPPAAAPPPAPAAAPAAPAPAPWTPPFDDGGSFPG